MNKKQLYKVLGILGFTLFLVFGGLKLDISHIYAANFAPDDATYIVTTPNSVLTSEILTTQLTTNLIASTSAFNLGSTTKPWGSIYGNNIVTNSFTSSTGSVSSIFESNTFKATTFSSDGAVTLSSGGTNQNVAINPTGTGRMLVGGESLVVARLINQPASPSTGQIYFNTASGSFKGYNGSNWVGLTLPTKHFAVDHYNTLMDSLVSYWKFDESAGANTTADFYSSNNLSKNGSATFASGKINNSTDLTRTTSDYWSISNGSQTGLGITSDMSVSLWVKFDSTSANQYFLGKTDAGLNEFSYRLGWETTNILKFQFDSDGSISSGNTTFSRSFTPSTGIWYHIVIAVDVSVPSATVYVNGSPVQATVDSSGSTSIFNGTGLFAIGNDGGNDNYTDGMIDEVGIWSRLLNGQEVADLYYGGFGETMVGN